jgi:FkbM family methyltransferase
MFNSMTSKITSNNDCQDSQLLESLSRSLSSDHSDRLALPKDYFNWGRDNRHMVDNSERLDKVPITENIKFFLRPIYRFIKYSSFGLPIKSRFSSKLMKYESFNMPYLLLSNNQSKELFSELLVMQILGEERFRLSIFDSNFVAKYEEASTRFLTIKDILKVYSWKLKRINLPNPIYSCYTTPVTSLLINEQRLYQYSNIDCEIDVIQNDVVIDCGVGWGDTAIYFASKTGKDGAVYSFDILNEGLEALNEQLKINPSIKNITPELYALSDIDDEDVFISKPSPGAHISSSDTGNTIKTITIDSYANRNNLRSIDFIKMDIEGSEVKALKGAEKTIKKYKPKLAISIYHKWDDLREIPNVINSLRDDYSFYLDCTTGFGGEAVLYCK